MPKLSLDENSEQYKKLLELSQTNAWDALKYYEELHRKLPKVKVPKTKITSVRRKPAICKRDTCTKPTVNWGLCKKHYDEVNETRKNERTWRLTKEGYIQVRYQGKWEMKHRLIMEEMLRRPLRKGESVHHINGIRDDNSQENLELWIGPIISGIRAKDFRCPHCNKPYSQF